MATVHEAPTAFASEPSAIADMRVQAGGYLLELSLDWIVLRASQNAHQLLGKSHVTLIAEPFGKFVQQQALHDLRNLFSRLSGTTGIGRAYRIRLTDEPELFDVAFQLSAGNVLLEAVPSPSGGFGEAFGSVGGLISGLANNSGQALLDGGARRMRALTGFDRVTLVLGEHRSESSRGAFSAPAKSLPDLPALIADTEAEAVAIFPRQPGETSGSAALMRAASNADLAELRSKGVRSILRVPVTLDGEILGEFRCDSRSPRPPNFEVHAAAELFAQLFAMRLEIDRMRSGGD